MKMLLDLKIDSPDVQIDYRDKIMLVGSCFTEHIGDALQDAKFNTLQNPNGIIFDPCSVTHSLVSYIENKQYNPSDFFYLNELWQSWQHHSRFSGTDIESVIEKINLSQQNAHEFIKQADWLIITLGTSYSYRLVEGNKPVANCHRAPQNWFEKHMLTVEESIVMLDNCLYRLFQFNPSLKVIFTVSPVRHIRDGIVQNNLSKARLLEVVHHMVNKFSRLYYFPSYEIVIDVLRDYRFYDIDLVHPNYQATSFVIEQFMNSYVNELSNKLANEIKQINIARKHKAFHPETNAHQLFLQSHAAKVKAMAEQYPFLDLKEELDYFMSKNG